MLHWWTSGGEAAALNVLKKDLGDEGYTWKDVPVSGGGGDAVDPRRRVRRPQHDPVQGPGRYHVIRVPPMPQQQARVLDAADRLGDTELGHGWLLLKRRCARMCGPPAKRQ